MKTSPLLSWPGGKTRLLKHLLPFIPEHSGYIEVFAGGLALLLAKEPSKLEVVNDIHGDIVNLYRVAKYHPDALTKELEFLLASRRVLQDLNELLKTNALTDVQRAAYFLHCNKTSFGGSGTSLAVARDPGSSAVIGKERLLANIQAFSQRLNRVVVENLDYRHVFKLYDHPGNFMFLDPPYLNTKAKNYRGWSEIEMHQFAAEVKKLKSRWIVTVDDSPLNRELWKHHHFIAVATQNGAVNRALVNKTFGELIIYSHKPNLKAPALKDA
jgi:DNA adenine methylase